jgi:lipopolysaccharide exporter
VNTPAVPSAHSSVPHDRARRDSGGKDIAGLAAHGAAWTIATGVGARALGLVGTLLLTYFVNRKELGEVADAAVAVVLANQLSTVGVGQYYVSRPTVGRDVAWHATVVHLLLGAAALALVLLLRRPLAVWMRAPALGTFLPGLVIAGCLDRLAYMPERVLARDMRFRVIGLCRTAAEISYTGTSVALAVAGWGGMSIVVANVARSAVRFALMAGSVPRAAWLSPAPLSLRTVRAMLRFGLPISVGMGAGFASRRIDNAIVSGLFGANIVGAYNLAYNVADAPAVQVGEQIGDVLLPSFALMDPGKRKEALARSTALLALVTFPLAVGLGAVAQPLVRTLLRPEWHDVGPMLALLSILGVVRPVGWTISSYLLARNSPRLDAILEIAKLTSLVALLLTVGRGGPLWACAAVGLAFVIHAVASMAAVQVLDGVSMAELSARLGPPLLSCVPMVGAIAATGVVLAPAGDAASLVAEVVVGAGAYIVSALVIARSTSRDLLTLVRRAWHGRLARSGAA